MKIRVGGEFSSQGIAKIISGLLVLMYGFVPIVLDTLGIYRIPWAFSNFSYSMALFFIILTLPNYNFKKYFFRFDFKSNYKVKTFLLFTVAIICFSLWGWTDDRVSAGASVSAFFRASWLLFCLCFINATENKKLLMLVLTAVLVFIDESRTYFMIAFFVLAISSNRKKIYFFIGMFTILLVAAVRQNESMTLLQMLTYGVVGEGYNGAKSVGQVIRLDLSNFSTVKHLSLTFLQPLYLPIQTIGGGLGFDLPQQSDVLFELTAAQLGEKLSPMGGWYILSDFIIYREVGVFYMALYIHWVWWLCNRVFNTRYFPIGAFLFFLSIKSSPLIFFKMMLYLILIATIVTALGGFKDKKQRGRMKNGN